MATPAGAPGKMAAPRGSRALSRALVRALGEFAAFAATERAPGRPRRRRGPAASVEAAHEKQAVRAWLRSLRADELAALCSVADAGFVKTVLSMAMVAARRGKARAPAGRPGDVVEFQLLPSALPRGKGVVGRRKAGEAAKTSQASAPRCGPVLC